VIAPNTTPPSRDELVALLSELVAAKTVNPPGDEHAAAEIVTRYLRQTGLPCESAQKQPGRTNVVARVGTGKPKLLVACHLDTVPAGEGWDTDPFALTVRGDRAYGRGVSDNKGQLAAVLLCAKRLASDASHFAGQLVLVAAADEEHGSELGFEYLLNECGLTAEYAIAPDVGGNMEAIDVAEKGVLFLTVRSVGKQAHGSMPHLGVNSVWNLVEALPGLRELPFLSARHPLLDRPTLNLGAVEGGSVHNMVPATASARIDVRYLPGQSPREIESQVRAYLDAVDAPEKPADFSVSIDAQLDPTQVPPGNPLVVAIQKHTADIGIEARPVGQPGATVAKQLIQHGITAVGWGPGDADQAHAANESISVTELLQFVTCLETLARDMLGP